MSNHVYLVHYYDSSRGPEGGSYSLYKTANEAVCYAVDQYNKWTEHEPLYCTVDKCTLESPLDDQKLVMHTLLEEKGEAFYPMRGSCVDGLDFMRIVSLDLN